MAAVRIKAIGRRVAGEHGMALVLVLLAGYYSFATLEAQAPSGRAAAGQLADRLGSAEERRVLIVAADQAEDRRFADTLEARLSEAGVDVVATVVGSPSAVRDRIETHADGGERIDVVAASRTAGGWRIYAPAGIDREKVRTPRPTRYPTFLKADNLINVTNQTVFIGVIAIGMTMVIITAGIDLSVGSLMALSAVLATMLIRDHAGGTEAEALGMVLCCLAAIAACAAAGAFNGVMVTLFGVPPFIVTLAMLLMARGMALRLAEAQSINAVPDGFTWLGRGEMLGIPHAVILMGVLYATAHVVMTRTILGRHIYAVGGNPEAARVSGVPVKRVLLFVYTLCGGLAGVAGVIMASQFASGDPNYGVMYELRVIAAVVVGGTSLLGGEGRVLGTLVGALIIAVINNGMNLTGVESFNQDIVLGAVILGAVLLDMLKKRGLAVLRIGD